MHRTQPSSKHASLLALLCALWAAACYTGADGRQPDPSRFYFPTGLAVSAGNTTLYVANSDFDLGYAGGWVQALDARALRNRVQSIVGAVASGANGAEACQAAGVGLNPDPWLNPGPCASFDLVPFVKNHAFIGAFASGLLLAYEPDGSGARLFVPVRGDPSITYFDVQDDRGASPSFTPTFQLSCNTQSDGFCGPDHRIGRDAEGTLRGLQLPADPVGIAANADGQALVSAHQTQATASLVSNVWSASPALTYFAGNLPAGPTEVAAIPEPAFVQLAEAQAAGGGPPFVYRDGFVLTFRAAAEIDILRYVPDTGSVPARPFITRAVGVPITTNSEGFDSRGVAIVDTERRACEAACQTVTETLDCLIGCAEQIPVRLYVANRTPPSVLVGRIQTIVSHAEMGQERVPTSAFEELFFFDTLPLSFGPSRVETGRIVNSSGELADRVFVVAFDSRTIFIIDPVLERVESIVRTGRGPHDIAVDSGIDADGEPFSFLYVGHFTDSYLGVVDLDQRRAITYGQMVASVGTPTPPQESR